MDAKHGEIELAPVEEERLEVKAPAKSAGGFTAIFKTLQHAGGKMGPVRATKALLRLNQKGGFDCQSCAWPDEDRERDVAAFCENGAKAVADEGMRARITEAFFAEHSVAALSARPDFWLNQQGRLTSPMVLREGATHYTPISWEDAFALVGEELRALASPDEAVFYTSGRTSNEAAFLYQLFVRRFGTNNLPDCSNMCHESSGAALNATLGIGKGTVTLEDFEKTDLILVIGQNPGTNHPRMLTALAHAKERGAVIVSVNPLPETGLRRFKHPQEVFSMLGRGTEITDLHLPVRIAGDMAFLQGVGKAVLGREDALDRAFIAERTEGFEAYRDAVLAQPWETLERESGLTRAQMEAVAELYVKSKATIACWAMGLTQQPSAVGTIQEVVNVLLLRGNVSRDGAGVCPVRGHSNVQGDRTMGIWEKPREAFLSALDREFDFTAPRAHGHDTVASIHAMHAGTAKVFLGLGGNFLSATPDTRFTAEALSRCRLTVQVSTKLNRAHLVTGKVGLILPCLGRSETDAQADGEQLVSCENSMGVVQSSQGRLSPASDALLSEVAIVAGVARATLGDGSGIDWVGLTANYDGIREHISRVIPGFDDYNRRVREPAGFYLPNGPREGTFDTPSKRARFTVNALPRVELAPGQLLLMTMRSHDQFNTTVYGLDDRYRGIYNGRRVLFANAEDLQALGLAKGQWVDITSHFRGQTREALRFRLVPFPIPRGCLAAYFPETNVLVPIDSTAEVSNTPTSKFLVVTLAPSPEVALDRV